MPKRSVVVEVTQEDIDKGVRADCRLCPVARALSRVTDGAVSVNGDEVILEREDFSQPCLWHRELAVLPFALAVDIERFDMHGIMEPATYKLEFEEC